MTGGVKRFPPVGLTLFSVGAGATFDGSVVVVVVVEGVVGCWSPGLEQPPMAKAASTRTAIRTAASARYL